MSDGGTPTFWKRELWDSYFQNPCESSELRFSVLWLRSDIRIGLKASVNICRQKSKILVLHVSHGNWEKVSHRTSKGKYFSIKV